MARDSLDITIGKKNQYLDSKSSPDLVCLDETETEPTIDDLETNNKAEKDAATMAAAIIQSELEKYQLSTVKDLITPKAVDENEILSISTSTPVGNSDDEENYSSHSEPYIELSEQNNETYDTELEAGELDGNNKFNIFESFNYELPETEDLRSSRVTLEESFEELPESEYSNVVNGNQNNNSNKTTARSRSRPRTTNTINAIIFKH